jgi:hypothetical protein
VFFIYSPAAQHNKLILPTQIYDSLLGWDDFRACGKSTFDYINAAMAPRYLLSSGSMSEDGLARCAGQMGEGLIF